MASPASDRDEDARHAPELTGDDRGFTVLKENTLIENFQPHFIARQAMQVEAFFRAGGRYQLSRQLQLQLDDGLHYDDDAAPCCEGQVIPRVGVVAQYQGEQDTRIR